MLYLFVFLQLKATDWSLCFVAAGEVFSKNEKSWQKGNTELCYLFTHEIVCIQTWLNKS